MNPVAGDPPLVAHLIYRLTRGGLENGLVNLINSMPAFRYRHAVVCITDFDDFRNEIRSRDVPVFALEKRPGHDPGYYRRLWRLLRELRPQLIHTRTFAALDSLWAALAAGVPARVHGEHGRDLDDWEREPRRRRAVRRLTDPIIDHYIAVSDDIASCLRRHLKVSQERITRIYNGVDTRRFRPAESPARRAFPPGFQESDAVVIGTVGNLREVKNPEGLIRAFSLLCSSGGKGRERLRLVMIGEGPLRGACARLVSESGLEGRAWLAGKRSDVPELLRGMDIFVLPSHTEGTSNAILEAMATGLPVVAVNAGGNAELVRHGETGLLVPSSEPAALAAAMSRYVEDAGLRRRHGAAGRRRAETFSLEKMAGAYAAVYDRVLAKRRRTAET